MESYKAVSKDVPNFLRLLFVTDNITVPLLRKMFKNAWKSLNEVEWENTSENGYQFIGDAGKNIYKESWSQQKNILSSGMITTWDLPLLIKCIKSLDKSTDLDAIDGNILSRSARNKNFDTLKEIRNELAHAGKMGISCEAFEDIWKTLSTILISFGIPQQELEDAKIAPLLQDKSTSAEDSSNNITNSNTAKELKGKGNDFYKRNQFVKAIELYSEAIQLSGILSEDLAILYSNRSVSHLKMEDIENAEDDAKGAIHLQPTWWKGYFRLGNVYTFSKNFEKGLQSFEIALKYTSAPKDIKELEEERDYCTLMINKKARNEHLDPMNYEESYDECAKAFHKRYGYSIDGKDLQSAHKRNLTMGSPTAICGEGHNYRFGRGVKQNNERAIQYYAKAASLGTAEGMYNLAQMTIEGQGVTRNISHAIELLKQAASQDLTIELVNKTKFTNIGVVESEHYLGLLYDEGVGVRQDFQKAIYWYTRAAKHGAAPAANNLGIMSAVGKGVEQNDEMAMQYWKLAASRKLVRAMENLAIHYLAKFDLVNAQKWFACGMKNESLTLKSREKEFKMIIGERGLKKTFKEDIFYLELQEEIQNGPLKHLIYEDPDPMIALTNQLKNATLNNIEGKDSKCQENSTSRKVNGISDPYRISILKVHRECVKEMMKRGEKDKYVANPAKLMPKAPSDLIGLKPIHFKDMDTSKDHIYEGFVIKLTLIEDAAFGRPSIPQIGEDENGDSQRIFVYNFQQNKTTQDSIGYGCRISIVNPYFRITQDGKPAIRVDDTSLMFIHSHLTDKKRCRYCGQEKCSIPCRKCKRAFYCSKKCLLDDASLLNHKLVCFKHL